MPIISEVKMDVGYEGSDICSRPNIKSILRYLGYTELDAMLAQNWSFSYLPDPDQDQRMIAVDGGVHGIYNHGLLRAGFESQMVMIDDDEIAWQRVKDFIDNRTPVLVWVDGYFLPFQKHRYRQSHTFHTVLCVGYEEDRVAHVMDGWASVRYEGPMDADLLKQARGSLNGSDEQEISWVAGNPVRNRYLNLGPPQHRRELSDLAEMYVRFSLEMADKKSAVSQNSEAILLIAENISKWRHIKESEAAQKLFDLYWLLIQVIVEKRNGPILLKHLDRNDSAVSEIHEWATSISQNWVICRNLIYRTSSTFEQNDIDRLLKRLESLASSEEKFTTRLRAVL